MVELINKPFGGKNKNKKQNKTIMCANLIRKKRGKT